MRGGFFLAGLRMEFTAETQSRREPNSFVCSSAPLCLGGELKTRPSSGNPAGSGQHRDWEIFQSPAGANGDKNEGSAGQAGRPAPTKNYFAFFCFC
jgi:hypothetical protein